MGLVAIEPSPWRIVDRAIERHRWSDGRHRPAPLLTKKQRRELGEHFVAPPKRMRLRSVRRFAQQRTVTESIVRADRVDGVKRGLAIEPCLWNEQRIRRPNGHALMR